MNHEPLLRVRDLRCAYGAREVVRGISFDLWPGEVLAVVGESGSGKSTLLNAVAARHAPSAGKVEFAVRDAAGSGPSLQDIYAMTEAQRRVLARTDWGFVHQHAADGLRMHVSAGANVSERLMALGQRHYGRLREQAADWLQRAAKPICRCSMPPGRSMRPSNGLPRLVLAGHWPGVLPRCARSPRGCPARRG